MKLSLTSYILAALVLFTLAGNLLQGCETRKLKRLTETNRSSLLRKDAEIKIRIDSLQKLQEKLARHDQYLVSVMQSYRDSLEIQSALTNKWRTQYAKIKNTRLPVMSDVQLDSVVTAIIGLDH